MSNVQEQTCVVGNKENKAFMILSALGILFVVDVHLGNSVSFLTQIFPYNSFFMPMFAFISGYFFREKHIRSWGSLFRFSVKKVKNLLLPYFFWIAFYGVLTYLLRKYGILEIGQISYADLIRNITTSGTSFEFNDPAWFVPLLFCVILSYCFIRKIAAKHWNDYPAMVFFALIGAAAVYASNTSFHTTNHYMLLKVSFFLQFYHLGVLFRNKLEAWFDNTSGLILCTAAVVINILLLAIYGDDISFPLCASMSGFRTNNPFLPLITSVTGITFWLKISKKLVPVLGQNRLVNFISDHTDFIMTHHLAVKHLFIGLMILGYRCGMECFSGIDVQRFRTESWYIYGRISWCKSACYLFTIAVLVISCKALCVLKDAFFALIPKRKQNVQPL